MIKKSVLIVFMFFIVSFLEAKGDIGSLDGLKEGMCYSKVRKTLLLNGWKVIKNQSLDFPEIGRENIFYYDKDWVEIDACSGFGAAYCLFKFKNTFGNILNIVTASESLDPKVKSWEINK